MKIVEIPADSSGSASADDMTLDRMMTTTDQIDSMTLDDHVLLVPIMLTDDGLHLLVLIDDDHVLLVLIRLTVANHVLLILIVGGRALVTRAVPPDLR